MCSSAGTQPREATAALGWGLGGGILTDHMHMYCSLVGLCILFSIGLGARGEGICACFCIIQFQS